ncbi:M23 family metallopeptidase [Bacillus sp. FJAT-45037]|uniref:M23 family metallopeptidase n=1 Tax=Bacillus sp. FJAT-45037 TaxID=2011007 RepID=UPI000C24F2F2|nr:M23 family metallopeptidase [Bacillus sp. FJAT-45037]
MRKVKRIGLMLLFLLVLITACQQASEAEQEQEQAEKEKEDLKAEQIEEVPIEVKSEGAFFHLDDLINVTGGQYIFDELHRTLQLTIHEDRFYMVDEVPVLERNGEYLATKDIYFTIDDQQNVYLPTAFIEQGLNIPVTYGEDVAKIAWLGPSEAVGGPPTSFNFDQWTVDQMVEHLEFLEKPIKDAEVSTVPSHLPGAPRAYRNGFHEGIDWYDFSSGGNINTDTPIYAMGEGIVVRVDHDYEEYPSPGVRNQDLAITAELGETPEYIFDRLRGMQVWVQYPNGVMNRFAHLDSIPDELQVGDRVNSETIIGYVGNSGTSGAVNKDLSGLHLHQDLLIYGELFWKPLTQAEVTEVLTRIWR